MRMILFFSHQLNIDQVNDAKINLKVDEFISLPPNLQTIFSNVPPQLENLDKFSKQFLEFLSKNAKKNDYVLIQGDFGLSYILVNFCLKNNLIPIYATTKRDVKIKEDGAKISVFKHVKFRKYHF